MTDKEEEGKMEIPSENTFQGTVIQGQFAPMGSESIDMGRMAASCVELLHRHLNMTAEDTARALGLTPDEVWLINRSGAATNPAVVPQRARPLIQKMCAIQSLLLSGYTFSSMMTWFKTKPASLSASPLDTLTLCGEEGVSRVLQAAMGRMTH